MGPARFFLAVALVATGVRAQEPLTASLNEPTLSGVVRDAGGNPVPDVEVGIIMGDRLRQFVITAADGKFLLTGVASGIVPLRVRRIGYAIQFFDVDSRIPSARALDIVLTAVPNELEEVTIAAADGRLREFYERKQQRGSFARFLLQSDIRRMGPTYSSDLFRSVPG